MLNTDWDALKSGSYDAFREEINTENRRAIRMLALAGIPLGFINFLAQLVIIGTADIIRQALLIIGWSFLLLGLERWLLPKEYPHSTSALYAAQVPYLLLSILLGTVWDPSRQAITILLFLILMPVFIMDRPLRTAIWMGLWSFVFLLVCRQVKARELFEADAIHVLEFFVSSLVITNVLSRVRMNFLENLTRTRYVLRHDEQTGCLSRYALDEETGRLVKKPLVILLADLDQLRLYRDFYGHSAADGMIRHFAWSFSDAFGMETTYRYGGDDLLCVVPYGMEGECLEKLELCRGRLHDFEHEGRLIPLTCGVGWVTGTPQSAEELRGMIQLAEIYANKAKHQGQDRTVGGAYSAERLRRGVIDSNLYTHAKPYEINQLTGLPDLSYFIARSDEMLDSVTSFSREPVLGYFKLMRLRDINNEFGYAQGDELIADTAGLLRKAFPERHLCYVTAGEFCILCYRDEAEQGAEIMRRELDSYKPGIRVKCRLGFAAWQRGQRTISLVDKAKIALNSVLKSGEDGPRFYDSALDEDLRFRQYILSHVDEAIEKGWLQVWYQPIARSVTGCVCSEEALSRWDDPRYGFLTPNLFIPLLEDSGLMYKVNLNVVRVALQDMKRRRELGVPVVPVSVNLSRRDFERCDMPAEIAALVEASDFPPEMLKIEITESAFVSNQDMLRGVVDSFHEKGFEVWLDDFGSEYSTLNLLQDLDFDLIKLDMRFMRNFKIGGKNEIIVEKLIEMAKRLGVDTLIEGVETAEHLEIMKRLGCGKIQGYLFNKPNPFEYIVKRALSGTGLVFETEDAAPYYQAVSALDLSEPLRAGWDGYFLENSEIPSGVIEQRGGRFYCLRWNESFRRHLQAFDIVCAEAAGGLVGMQMEIRTVPEALSEAASRCVSEDEWVSFDAVTPKGERATVFLRRVTDYSYNGGKAMLVALLPGR